MANSFSTLAERLEASFSENVRETFADPLVTQAQAAQLLGVSISTLSRWRAAGDGPTAIKLGGKIRYRLSDLKGFVDRSEIGIDADDAP